MYIYIYIYQCHPLGPADVQQRYTIRVSVLWIEKATMHVVDAIWAEFVAGN